MEECKVQVLPSPISGRGVFATSHISEGEFITHYGRMANMPSKLNSDYLLRLPNGSILCGNPERVDLRSCGYMMNDPRSIVIYQDQPLTSIFTTIDAYRTRAADECNNCNATVDSSGNVIACRSISTGEEITLYYGTSYWLNDCMRKLTGHTKLLIDFIDEAECHGRTYHPLIIDSEAVRLLRDCNIEFDMSKRPTEQVRELLSLSQTPSMEDFSQ